MAVYICPVCKGRGIVPSSFYQLDIDGSYDHPSLTATNTTPIQCRSCDGRGVIFDSIVYKPNIIIDDDISDNTVLNQYSSNNIQEAKQPIKPVLNDGFLGKVSPD